MRKNDVINAFTKTLVKAKMIHEGRNRLEALPKTCRKLLKLSGLQYEPYARSSEQRGGATHIT